MDNQLLQNIWRDQCFDKQSLELNNGAEFQVIYPGQYSNDVSAFTGAIIKIAGILWVGDVLLFLKTAELVLHESQSDLKDDKVILYVVWANEESHYNTRIPAFYLQSRVSISQPPITRDDQNNIVNESKGHYLINGNDQADNEVRIIDCLHELIGIYKKKAPQIRGKIRSLKIVTWQRETIRFYMEYGGHAKHVPKIMLLGNWLTKAGFNCEDMACVIPLTNMLIIIPQKQ